MDLKILETEVIPLEDDWFEVKIKFNYEEKILSFFIKPGLQVEMDRPYKSIFPDTISTTNDAYYVYESNQPVEKD